MARFGRILISDALVLKFCFAT